MQYLVDDGERLAIDICAGHPAGHSHVLEVCGMNSAVDSTVPVSVLFTDIVGSTELLSRVGPEKADRLRREHFALLRPAIDVAGGTEVKNLGDGLMVVFKTATSALQCAVDMQQSVYAANLRSAEPLGLRVALAFVRPRRRTATISARRSSKRPGCAGMRRAGRSSPPKYSER